MCWARLGGDEFAALVDVGLPTAAETYAANVISAIYQLQSGSADDRSRPRIGASVGIAVIDDARLTPEEALARADDACYSAKISGRQRYVRFDQGLANSTAGLTAASLASDLLDALDNDRLLLFGQRICPLSDDQRDQARIEILSRLKSRCGAIIGPDRFISAAERFGIASRLDRWIIAEGLRCYGHLMRDPKGLMLGINLSTQTLSDPGLWPYVENVLCSTGVAPQNIVFEITETAAVTNLETAEAFVLQAKRHQCRISLDDFGAGLSSFEYLRRFPVDSIKINGSFIQNIEHNDFDQAFVKAMCDVAKAVGYKVVAEKIESDAALRKLREFSGRLRPRVSFAPARAAGCHRRFV